MFLSKTGTPGRIPAYLAQRHHGFHIRSTRIVAPNGMAVRSAENLTVVLEGRQPRDLINKEV
jgi:hypothetical protein